MKGRRAALGVLIVLTLFGLPPAAARPASISVVKTPHAEAVDFESGRVWFLLIGSDARPGQDVLDGRADALQLVGIDFDTGRAVALGVPRDFWVEIPGAGFMRINETLSGEDAGLQALDLGGPELVAETVGDVVGIKADYVITAGVDGFAEMVDAIDGVTVHYRGERFNDEDHPLPVHPGINRFDGDEAATFARVRKALDGGDFERSANHQLLLTSIARQLQRHADDVGFMEFGTLAALASVDTDLSPTELYRLGQAVTQLDLSRVSTCVLPGSPFTSEGQAQVLEPVYSDIRAIVRDVSRDMQVDDPC